MDFKEYRAVVAATALYPGSHTGSLQSLAYCGLGLAGEAAEFAQVIKDGIKVRLDVIAELGDCMWYADSICAELGIDTDILFFTTSKEEYKPILDEREASVRLLVACGLVSNDLKKLMRDANSIENVKKAMHKTAHVLRTISNVAEFLGVDIHHVMQINAEKLESRKARGVIQGSGDHR